MTDSVLYPGKTIAAVWHEIPVFSKAEFLDGLTMGLCNRNTADITYTDCFTMGYLLGIELRNSLLNPDMIPIRGDANGLQYAFDQGALRLDVTDTGVDGNTFTLVGAALIVDPGEVSFNITIDGNIYRSTVPADYTWLDLYHSGGGFGDLSVYLVDGASHVGVRDSESLSHGYIYRIVSLSEYIQVEDTDFIAAGNNYICR